MNPNPSSPDTATLTADPAPQVATQNLSTPEPPISSKNYFELRLRIRYWWLWTGLAVLAIAYPIAVIYMAASMHYSQGSNAPDRIYSKQWEATGCPDRMKRAADDQALANFSAKHQWKHWLKLDDSSLSLNSQDILSDPLCVGAKIELLRHKPGPWRYDIVDTQSQKIIVSITPGK